MRACSVVTLFAASAVGMLGCSAFPMLPETNRGIAIDAMVDQPLGADARPAFPARVSIRGHGVYSDYFLEWPRPDGGWIDSRDVVRRAERHLERSGADRREVTLDPGEMDLARRGPDGRPGPIHIALSPIWTIVSLDPLVLVETPGTIQDEDTQADMVEPYRPSDGPPRVRVYLGHGFNYGLRVPYTPAPRWTSPAAGDRIHETQEISPTERLIVLPGRSIRLERDGDAWRALPADPSG